MKKSKGGIEILIVWFSFLVVILVMFVTEIYFLNIKASMTQDDIAFSNLATYRDIDRLALADDPTILVLSNPYVALNTFKEYLMKNMKLDNNLAGKPNSIAIGAVNIKTYIIYNIRGSQAEIHTYNSSTKLFNTQMINDITVTPINDPDGNLIKKTAVYTVLNFDVEPVLKGIVGNTKNVNVKALTFITK